MLANLAVDASHGSSAASVRRLCCSEGKVSSRYGTGWNCLLMKKGSASVRTFCMALFSAMCSSIHLDITYTPMSERRGGSGRGGGRERERERQGDVDMVRNKRGRGGEVIVGLGWTREGGD